MQYVIKLKNKLKINRRKNEFIYLRNQKCRLLKSVRTTNKLIIEADSDLSEAINAMAKFTQLEILMLDHNHYHKRFLISKNSHIDAYQNNGLLLQPSGRCSSDTEAEQLYYYLKMCDKPV